MLDVLVEGVTHSWFTMLAAMSLLGAAVVSVLSGLLDVAVYILLAAAAVFLVAGLVVMVV